MQATLKNNDVALRHNIEKVCVVSITNNYGREAIYPVNDAAKSFARIADTRTLTRETIRLVKQLGYRVDVEPSAVEL